jgi:pimeloyl-ACP methyl ester carboxylesterase
VPSQPEVPYLPATIAPGNPGGLTGIYSFRLSQAFGTTDYAADLRNATSPITVLVGEKDELFLAEQFAPTIHAARAEVPVLIVLDLGHIQMITDPRAVPAIVAAIRGVTTRLRHPADPASSRRRSSTSSFA